MTMIFVIEAIVLCILFTLMVFTMAKDPIKTLYNYPPKIQERVKFLPQYQNQIPTQKNKVIAKLGASVLFITILFCATSTAMPLLSRVLATVSCCGLS